MNTETFATGWRWALYRFCAWVFYASLSMVTVVSIAGLAGYVWARWLA